MSTNIETEITEEEPDDEILLAAYVHLQYLLADEFTSGLPLAFADNERVEEGRKQEIDEAD